MYENDLMIQDPREKAADACCLKQARHSQVQSQPNKPCWEAHLSEVALYYLCTQDLQGLARRRKKARCWWFPSLSSSSYFYKRSACMYVCDIFFFFFWITACACSYMVTLWHASSWSYDVIDQIHKSIFMNYCTHRMHGRSPKRRNPSRY
jgi:hypothetical protein